MNIINDRIGFKPQYSEESTAENIELTYVPLTDRKPPRPSVSDKLKDYIKKHAPIENHYVDKFLKKKLKVQTIFKGEEYLKQLENTIRDNYKDHDITIIKSQKGIDLDELFENMNTELLEFLENKEDIMKSIIRDKYQEFSLPDDFTFGEIKLHPIHGFYMKEIEANKDFRNRAKIILIPENKLIIPKKIDDGKGPYFFDSFDINFEIDFERNTIKKHYVPHIYTDAYRNEISKLLNNQSSEHFNAQADYLLNRIL